jgi:agmatine deiminase
MLFAACAAPPLPAPTSSLPAESPAPAAWLAPPSSPATSRAPVGEHEPVSEVVLGWHEGNAEVFDELANLIAVASWTASVRLLVAGPGEARELAEALAASGVPSERLRFQLHPVDSMWIRDYGPLFVRTDGALGLLDLPYHEARMLDDQVPFGLGSAWGLTVRSSDIPLEGGHIATDGAGRCVVSEAEVVGDPGLAAVVEWKLRRSLGCSEVIYVPELLDEPTGHVDLFLHLPGPLRALVGSYPPHFDPENAARLDEVAARLQAAGFRVDRVPMPDHDGRIVFRSYLNLLVVNDLVIVPIYEEIVGWETEEALAAIALAHPSRDVVPLPADGLIESAGAFHCVAITLPATPPNDARRLAGRPSASAVLP